MGVLCALKLLACLLWKFGSIIDFAGSDLAEGQLGNGLCKATATCAKPANSARTRNTSSNHLTLQNVDGSFFSSKQSSHQTKPNNKKLTSTGFKQQRITTRLLQQGTKSIKKLAPTNPILGPENLLKTGFARKGLPSSAERSEAARWLSWYGVALASADRLPVVVRIPAGPLGSFKCDPPKGNGRRPQKSSAERSVTLHSFDFTKYRLWTSLF